MVITITVINGPTKLSVSACVKRSKMFLFCLLWAVLLVLVGCSTQPKRSESKRETSVKAKVVQDALSLEGIPYNWGMESPEKGFDCSGFVHYLYANQGINLPRTAYDMAVSLKEPTGGFEEPGDLVFFNTTGMAFSHVGILLSKNRFVHASSSQGGVTVSSLESPYWAAHFQGVRSPHLIRRKATSQGRWYP